MLLLGACCPHTLTGGPCTYDPRDGKGASRFRRVLFFRSPPLDRCAQAPLGIQDRAERLDALESEKNVLATHGVFNMTPTDHLGFDPRARVMARIENGAWKLISP